MGFVQPQNSLRRVVFFIPDEEFIEKNLGTNANHPLAPYGHARTNTETFVEQSAKSWGP